MTPLNPNWVVWRDVTKLIDDCIAGGTRAALLVATHPGPVDALVAKLRCRTRRIALTDLIDVSLEDEASVGSGYELCVCSLNRDGLRQFPAIVRLLARKLKGTGRIIAFYQVHPQDTPLDEAEIAQIEKALPPAHVLHLTGSPDSHRALTAYCNIADSVRTGSLRQILLAPLRLLKSFGRSVLARRSEIREAGGRRPPVDQYCVSVTIDIPTWPPLAMMAERPQRAEVGGAAPAAIAHHN